MLLKKYIQIEIHSSREVEDLVQGCKPVAHLIDSASEDEGRQGGLVMRKRAWKLHENAWRGTRYDSCGTHSDDQKYCFSDNKFVHP